MLLFRCLKSVQVSERLTVLWWQSLNINKLNFKTWEKTPTWRKVDLFVPIIWRSQWRGVWFCVLFCDLYTFCVAMFRVCACAHCTRGFPESAPEIHATLVYRKSLFVVVGNKRQTLSETCYSRNITQCYVCVQIWNISRSVHIYRDCREAFTVPRKLGNKI